ncbi:MAG: alpha/beta hydrolase [Aggregatilineales bacterium]
MPVPILDGITAKMITSPRITTRVLLSGDENGIPVVFVHGNASSATFWEETMLALPSGFRGVAPDLRGYGDADREKLIDATRGMGDFSDDLAALFETLNIDKAHVIGHSLGGGVLWRFMMDHPNRILTVTMVAPGSPYGFAGTKDLDGTPNYADFAGCGGGTVNPEFPKLMALEERGSENPQASPRIVMNSFYWKPPFIPAREEDLLSSLLSEHVGEQAYPGDLSPSENWPNVAPGKWGPINALTPAYLKPIDHLYSIDPKPPVLWVRGSDDQIVSDNSLFDMGTLGKLGAIPGWPGDEVFPPQPMIRQTRTVLEKYREHGGKFSEVVISDTGHTPYIEKPDEFNQHFHAHLTGA